MVKWTILALVIMTAGLSFLGITGALTIDNQLTVIKNDCFERHTIGQRLNSRDVYNTVELNTVPDCQRECTKEGDRCRTFSFGIGVKGNASCELSSKVIKDTADLKPIGTVSDSDYDLYIKKLGCKLVIDPSQSGGLAPADVQNDQESNSDYGQDNKPTPNTLQVHYNYGDNSGSGSEDYRPTKNDVHKNEPMFRPDNGYGVNNPRPYGGSANQHVETTLISIRPDPNRPGYTGLGGGVGLHDSNRPDPPRPLGPIEDSYGYGYGYGMDRPLRPISRPYGNEFNGRPVRPYDDEYGNRPRPDYFAERPYGNTRPITFGPPDYDPDRYDKHPQRPNYYEDDARPPFRPSTLNRPYNEKPYYRPSSSDMGYSNEIPKPDFDRLDGPRPYLDRPISEKPRPDYGRPDGDRFNFDYQRPNRPSQIDRPSRPRPNFSNSDGYGRPEIEEDRPIRYGRPKPNRRPIGYGSDFVRPDFDKGRPDFDRRPDYDSYGRPYIRPHMVEPFLDRPSTGRPQRPRPNFEIDEIRPYDEKFRPHRPHRPRPNFGPVDEGYGGDRPDDFTPDFERPVLRPDVYRPNQYNDVSRPVLDRPKPSFIGGYDDNSLNIRPNKNSLRPYDPNNPNMQYPNEIKPVSEGTGYNRRGDNFKDGITFINQSHLNQIDSSSKPIVSQTVGPHGETITSIITEIKPCK